MSQQTVDVIIPTYNGLPYLKQTIDSVLGQSHKDLVLYVIDDGSTDKAATKKYVASLKDPRVRYKYKTNGGQAEARNYGIRLSTSPFVALIDADDIWHKDKLKKQLKLMDSNPKVGMVYGLCKLIDETNNIFDEVVWKKRGQLFTYLLGGNKISGSASMVLVRREAFDKVGLFHEDFLIGEDWEMWLRIAKDFEIDFVDDFIASLRVRGDGMQQNYTKMARGLNYMLPIMVRELRLGPINRARLGKTCLKEACFLYYNGGEKPMARRMFIKSLFYNPLAFFTLNYHVWFLYVRILFGNDMVRSLRRKLSSNYRTRELDSIAQQSNTLKNPMVSIVMPAYNAEKYIARAIDSILGQTFQDFELIINNDGSTDKTQAIIDKYKDPRIVSLREKKNVGIVTALNNALSVARGKYIARQDADDTSAPLRLQRQVEMMHKHHHLVLVGSRAVSVDTKGKKTGSLDMPLSDNAIRVGLFSYNPFIHGSVLFRSDVLTKVGTYRQEAWPAEDYDLWQRLVREGDAMNIDEPLYSFTVNESGISQSNLKKQADKTVVVRRDVFNSSARILGGILTLRRALPDQPAGQAFKKNVRLVARVSLLHLQPINFTVACLNLLLALGVSKEIR